MASNDIKYIETIIDFLLVSWNTILTVREQERSQE